MYFQGEDPLVPIALASTPRALAALPDPYILAGQLAPASIAGYRRDVALYLRFCGAAATALVPAWPLHFYSVWPGWGSLPLGRPLGGSQERWRRPQPAEDAPAAVALGGRTARRPGAPWGATRMPTGGEHGAQRPTAACSWRG